MSEHDDEGMFIIYCDVLLCLLAYVLAVMTMATAKVDGIKDQSWFLVSIDWDVSKDADVDLWLATPSQKPVYYGSRDVGCIRLDTDSRGFMDGHVRLPDGSYATVKSYKETAQFRCIQAGHYELAANLFAYRENGMRVEGRNDLDLKAHAEINAENPSAHLVYSGDVTLNSVGQTANVTGFDLDAAGNISLTPPQLEEVTAAYARKQAGSSYTPGSAP